MRTSVVSIALALFVVATELPAAAQDSVPSYRRRNVAIVVFPGVELLDFAGPGEVFAVAHAPEGHAFQTYTVARTTDPVKSMNFVTITPQYTLDDCPVPDIVVVPGGDVPTSDLALREWIQARAKTADLMMSVCNGALVYANAGLLRGLEVTTHHSALQSLALFEPNAKVFTNRRFVDNGKVLTAAGIAAGIDGSLHVVERFYGQETAWRAARQMEYDWRPDEIAKLHALPGTPVDNSEALRLVGSIQRLGAAGALAEFKQLEKPPSENQMNSWGYALLSSSRPDEALLLFQLVADAHPQSPNAFDSLSEALERKNDRERALTAARACLALIEKGGRSGDRDNEVLRNAAASRVARLTDAPASRLGFVCPPCGGKCDEVGYLEAGKCPGCPMQLVARSN
jgi:transcriptional regulator GlxA family with amidase domain